MTAALVCLSLLLFASCCANGVLLWMLLQFRDEVCVKCGGGGYVLMYDSSDKDIPRWQRCPECRPEIN